MKFPLSHLEEHQRSKTEEYLFTGTKEDIGAVPGIIHKIVTQEERSIVNRQWRLPESTMSVIPQEYDKVLAAGVIYPSNSPWLSPVVLVRKKDGSLRGLNAVTVADTYLLPRIDVLLDELGGTSIFTCLDSRSAYWSITVEKADRPKTTFSDGRRLLQFVHLPFGLATATTTFQRTINVVLGSVLGRHTLAYLDYVIIHNKTFDEQLSHLEETLQLLSEAGFKMNVEKCDFVKTSIKFLGFCIDKNGILPDPENTHSSSEMSIPKTARGVRQFWEPQDFSDVTCLILRPLLLP